MIRKYLICGKEQIFLQSKNIDTYNELGKVIEVLYPIRDFWRIKSELDELEYLISSGEASTEIASAYRKILKSSARWAVNEEDRAWLYDRSKD